ncbi:MAG: HEAT repeat domain-containing protein, partial [Cyanobacteria bacterium P01_F01_bin.3]
MDGDRLAQLEEQLRSGSVFQCKLALDELETCPSEQAVPVLQKLLDEKDVVRRRFAVMGLAH